MSRQPERGGIPAWVLAVLPLAAAVAIGIAIVTLFPGAPPETARESPSADPTASPAPFVARTSSTPHPAPTPHPATRSRAAWTVGDGELYRVGGRSDGRATSSAVAFDGRVWRDLPPAPDARVGAALGVFADGTLVLAGGQLDGVLLDTTLLLAPGAADWSPAPAMPHPQSFAAYAVLGDRLYLFGGAEAGRADAALAFDAATSTWAELTPMPVAVSRASAAAHDDALYVTGGLGEDDQPRAEAHRYDPGTDTWTPLAPLPVATASHASAVVDGRLWLIGTGSFTDAGFGPIPVYDLAAGTWALIDDTNGSAAGEGVAVMVQPSGDIFVVGALGGTSTVRTP